MKMLVNVGWVFFFVFGLVYAQDLPRLDGRTAAEWRHKFETDGFLAGLNSITPVSDQTVQVIDDLLQDDSLIATQLLDVISKANRNPATRSTNDLSKMVSLLPSIKKHAFSTNCCLQMAAISALGSFGLYAKDYADDVARLLDNNDSFVRANAADALSAFGDSAIPFLEKLRIAYLREDNDDFARKRIKKAIGKIEFGTGDVSGHRDK